MVFAHSYCSELLVIYSLGTWPLVLRLGTIYVLNEIWERDYLLASYVVARCVEDVCLSVSLFGRSFRLQTVGCLGRPAWECDPGGALWSQSRGTSLHRAPGSTGPGVCPLQTLPETALLPPQSKMMTPVLCSALYFFIKIWGSFYDIL